MISLISLIFLAGMGSWRVACTGSEPIAGKVPPNRLFRSWSLAWHDTRSFVHRVDHVPSVGHFLSQTPYTPSHSDGSHKGERSRHVGDLHQHFTVIGLLRRPHQSLETSGLREPDKRLRVSLFPHFLAITETTQGSPEYRNTLLATSCLQR